MEYAHGYWHTGSTSPAHHFAGRPAVGRTAHSPDSEPTRTTVCRDASLASASGDGLCGPLSVPAQGATPVAGTYPLQVRARMCGGAAGVDNEFGPYHGVVITVTCEMGYLPRWMHIGPVRGQRHTPHGERSAGQHPHDVC